MQIIPENKNVTSLLSTRCQFEIPRFQRDYSWETKHYQEFIDDMLENLKFDNNTVTPTDYFLGTMLFIGTMEKPGNLLKVVDGQQRLTTITILFSALSDHFKEVGEDKLSEKIFEYIMSEDNNGEIVRILKSESSYPFFSYFIQDRKKTEGRAPSSEEEECIKIAYEYLYKRTSEPELKRYFPEQYDKKYETSKLYVNLLKAIRDQVLNSTIVTICTKDKQDSNRIFEILNAKGKRLASIDLIKNIIFENLKTTEPVDDAEVKWEEIKNSLYSGNNTVGLATFFRHYWSSKYSNESSENKLYDSFKKTIKGSSLSYKEFLEDLVKNAKYYKQIINPDNNDYSNRKEYFGLVQSLKIISSYFNIVQIRTILLSLFDARDRKILGCKDFKKLVSYLERFHFAYNALLAKRANIIDGMYKKYAKQLRTCNSRQELSEVIRRLRNDIEKQYPTIGEFKDAFIKLNYSKKEHPDNIKTKYAINILYCYYSGVKKEVFAEDGSIEHILPESSGLHALNIGNLILLEGNLNNNADNVTYEDKRIHQYAKSSYKWVKDFSNAHTTWNDSDIDQRAEEMAEDFYNNILKVY